jgi:hypothetical protein
MRPILYAKDAAVQTDLPFDEPGWMPVISSVAVSVRRLYARWAPGANLSRRLIFWDPDSDLSAPLEETRSSWLGPDPRTSLQHPARFAYHEPDCAVPGQWQNVPLAKVIGLTPIYLFRAGHAAQLPLEGLADATYPRKMNRQTVGSGNTRRSRYSFLRD